MQRIDLLGPRPWWFFAFLSASPQHQPSSQSSNPGNLARDISLGLIRAAKQLAGEDGWNLNYQVLVASTISWVLTWAQLPQKLLGSRTSCVIVRHQAVPIFLPQLTKTRSGNLNLHLNLCVGHLMPRPTISKINNSPVPLALPDGCCYTAAIPKWNWHLHKRMFLKKALKMLHELTLLIHLLQKTTGFLGRQATYAFLYTPKQ